MHALLVTAHIEPGRNEEEGVRFMQSDVTPRFPQSLTSAKGGADPSDKPP